MPSCLSSRALKVFQTANERQPYAFDLTDDFANLWEAGRNFAAAATIRPLKDQSTGLEYVSSGGVSGKREPRWPNQVGGTATDGTITWTAQALSTDSLKWRISTIVWTADAGITASDQVDTDAASLQEARIYASGGESGTTYMIRGLVTADPDSSLHECLLEVGID